MLLWKHLGIPKSHCYIIIFILKLQPKAKPLNSKANGFIQEQSSVAFRGKIWKFWKSNRRWSWIGVQIMIIWKESEEIKAYLDKIRARLFWENWEKKIKILPEPIIIYQVCTNSMGIKGITRMFTIQNGHLTWF